MHGHADRLTWLFLFWCTAVLSPSTSCVLLKHDLMIPNCIGQPPLALPPEPTPPTFCPVTQKTKWGIFYHMSFELFSSLPDLIDLTDKALCTAIRSEIDSKQSRDPTTAEMMLVMVGWLLMKWLMCCSIVRAAGLKKLLQANRRKNLSHDSDTRRANLWQMILIITNWWNRWSVCIPINLVITEWIWLTNTVYLIYLFGDGLRSLERRIFFNFA